MEPCGGWGVSSTTPFTDQKTFLTTLSCVTIAETVNFFTLCCPEAALSCRYGRHRMNLRFSPFQQIESGSTAAPPTNGLKSHFPATYLGAGRVWSFPDISTLSELACCP